MDNKIKEYLEAANTAVDTISNEIDAMGDDGAELVMKTLATTTLKDLKDTHLNSFFTNYADVETLLDEGEVYKANEKILETCFAAGQANQLINLLPPSDHKIMLSAVVETVLTLAQKHQHELISLVANVNAEPTDKSAADSTGVAIFG